MEKLHLTIVNNPFDPIKNREQWSFSYDPIPIGAYLKKAGVAKFEDEELNVVYGGRPLTPEEIDSVVPMPGDRFAVIPMVAGSGGGGDDSRKQVLSLVTMIALMYAGGAGGAALFGKGTVGASIFAAGVQMVGGYFVNQYMQKHKQTQQDDKTYGWEITTNMTPGGAIPETCGTVRTGGTCISYRVTSDGDKQYANILLDGGIGPLDIDEETGEITGIDINSIMINNEPLANYDGQNSTFPEVYIRAGLNDQEVIPNFGDTYSTVAFGDELKVGDDYVVHEIDSDGASGLEVSYLCPKGLYRLDGTDYKSANILLDIQYQKFGDTTWSSFPAVNGNSYVQFEVKAIVSYDSNHQPLPVDTVSAYGDMTSSFTVGAQYLVFSSGDPVEKTVERVWMDGARTKVKFTSTIPRSTYAIGYATAASGELMLEGSTPRSFRKSFRIDNLPVGKYYVRSKCLFKSGPDDNQNYGVQIYWESLSYIFYDDFCYPNHILLGIRALASDKLSGSISNVTWIQTVSKCWVYNPTTQAYEQKDKTNPAWRAYDIYHQAQRLKNINTGQYEMIVRGEAASKINYAQFARWATFCDTYNIKCNYIHDKTVTRSEALNPIHLIGRGTTYQSGTQITCTFDEPVTEPVQIFNSSNICEGGITFEYINTRDRANAVEIKFRDAARDYEYHTFPIYTEEYESDTGVQNPTQITLDACTDYTEAFKHGMYELKVNKHLIRSASWPAELDSIASVVGDVVGLQNELPKWGIGGRIVEVGNDWIRIDHEVVFSAGKTYKVVYRLIDDSLSEHGVNNTAVEKRVVLFGMGDQVQGSSEMGDKLQFSSAFTEDTEPAQKVDVIHFSVVGDQTLTYHIGATIVLESDYNKTDALMVLDSFYDPETNRTTVGVLGVVPDSLYQVRFGFTKPRAGDLYCFGEEAKMYKLFKVTSISLDGDQKRKITALEHIPEVYQDDTEVPPEVDYDNSQSQMITITANETVNQLSGKAYLNVAWTPTQQYNGALVLIDGKQVYKAKISETSYSMEVQSLKEYTITVKTFDLFGNKAAEGTIKYTVRYNPPSAPVSVSTSQILGGSIFKISE